MGSTTPFYAFPYPIGTDRVMDGDDAIKALAERVEAVLGKGTGASTRAWSSKQTAGGSIGAGTWTSVIGLTCTGAPVGAILAVLAASTFSPTTAGGLAQARIVSAGATMTTPVSPKVNASGANVWLALPVFAIATVTVASPAINTEWIVNSGSLNIDPESHMIAVRII